MQILFKFFDSTSECFAKYNAFCLHVFDVTAEGVRFITVEEIRNYGKIVHIKNIFENGWWEGRIPVILPPGYKLQKPSKESGIFYSLGTINFVLFY